jgi:hypothetical protein
MVIKVYSSFMKNNNKSKIFANKCSALPQLELNIFPTCSDIHKILFCITVPLSYELKKEKKYIWDCYPMFLPNSLSLPFLRLLNPNFINHNKNNTQFINWYIVTQKADCWLAYLVETLGKSFINDIFFSPAHTPSQGNHDLTINDYVLRFVIHS